MSLERVLADALPQVDRYEPSLDLFARVTRSIEEDRVHRRRVRLAAASTVVFVTAITGFLAAMSNTSASGVLVVPRWSIEIVEALVLLVLLLGLGPAIRRFGQPLLADVFHLRLVTGLKFSRLLDIAYYLFFSGVILSDVDLVALSAPLAIPEAIVESLSRLAVLMTAIGLAHTGNLLLLPLVGLVFGSVVRRGRRRAAGRECPPVSPRAVQADRIVTWIIGGLAALIVAGLLIVGAVVVIGIG
jgi:hypothetical protein